MSVAKKVLDHLEAEKVEYRVLRHPHTGSSQETAEAAHVSGDRLAKAVVLDKESGGRLLAVLPASLTVHYPELEARFDCRVHPVDEDALGDIFLDCEVGAVPPFGALYGLTTAVDEALLEDEPIYFEAGDHESVVQVSAKDFKHLMGTAEICSFARHHE